MKPLHNRLVVKRLDSAAETSFGFILETEPIDECTVIAIGPDVQDVKVGETIILSRNVGQAVKHDDEWVTVITEDDVLAIIERE